MADSLRVGVVGSGYMAGIHLRSWRTLGVPLSVYSTGGNVAERATANRAARHGSLAELIDSCDVVDICTPPASHLSIASAAAAAGRQVICEKPMARSHSEALELIDVCERAGVHLLIAHVVRYFPQYAAASQTVAADRVGNLAVLRLSRRTAMPSQHWYADDEHSGGVLVDLMIHDFDFARWVAGEVETIFAKVTHASSGTSTGYAMMRHTGGALSQLTGVWGPPGQRFSSSFNLSGSNGAVRFDNTMATALQVDIGAPAAGDAPAAVVDESAELRPYVLQLADFADVISGATTPRLTAIDGLAALDLALAARLSARTGRPTSPLEMAR
ncbi:MAG: Gfo/Idh/MocA family protein [Nakamurella sp.]